MGRATFDVGELTGPSVLDTAAIQQEARRRKQLYPDSIVVVRAPAQTPVDTIAPILAALRGPKCQLGPGSDDERCALHRLAIDRSPPVATSWDRLTLKVGMLRKNDPRDDRRARHWLEDATPGLQLCLRASELARDDELVSVRFSWDADAPAADVVTSAGEQFTACARTALSAAAHGHVAARTVMGLDVELPCGRVPSRPL